MVGHQHVYRVDGVARRWFHYAQAIIEIVHLCLIWCRVVRSRDVHPCYLVSQWRRSQASQMGFGAKRQPKSNFVHFYPPNFDI